MPRVSFTEMELKGIRQPEETIAAIENFILNLCGDVEIEIIRDIHKKEVV